MLRRIILVGAVSLASACMVPPSRPIVPFRPAPSAVASYDAVWNAAIQYVGERNLPLQALDKTSGLLSTADMAISMHESSDWSVCGSEASVAADHVRASILIRPVEGGRVRVQVSATWWRVYGFATSCTSKRRWEQGLEDAILARATGAP